MEGGFTKCRSKTEAFLEWLREHAKKSGGQTLAYVIYVFSLRSVFASESDLVELLAPYFCSTWRLLRWDWELVVNTWAWPWLYCCMQQNFPLIICIVWWTFSGLTAAQSSKYQSNRTRHPKFRPFLLRVHFNLFPFVRWINVTLTSPAVVER